MLRAYRTLDDGELAYCDVASPEQFEAVYQPRGWVLVTGPDGEPVVHDGGNPQPHRDGVDVAAPIDELDAVDETALTDEDRAALAVAKAERDAANADWNPNLPAESQHPAAVAAAQEWADAVDALDPEGDTPATPTED